MTHFLDGELLPGDTAIQRNLDYERDTLSPEAVLAENAERFVAAKNMAAYLESLKGDETRQHALVESLKTETGVHVPEENTPEYSGFLSRYDKGQMTEDEKRVRNAIIDLGQLGLLGMLAALRADRYRVDDFAFATAHLDVLRAEAEAEMNSPKSN